jgi:hypothetical protein
MYVRYGLVSQLAVTLQDIVFLVTACCCDSLAVLENLDEVIIGYAALSVYVPI